MTREQSMRRMSRLIFPSILLLTLVTWVTTWAVRKGEKHADTGLAAANTKSTAPAVPAADTELGQQIDRAIDTSNLSSARCGVSVVSLADGRTLYARNADRLFTLASNMKIYTTAVALDLLGPAYQWRTSIYADSQPDSAGFLKGDLTLYGRGAPDLSSQPKIDQRASLAQLVDQLYQRGLRHLGGNVVGDNSYFRAELFGNGWQWNDLQWYFGAEPSALSINANQVSVEIKPATNAGEPALATVTGGRDYTRLSNEMLTVKRGEQMSVGVNRGLTNNEIRLWGQIPLGTREFGYRLSVHNPALWAAGLLVAALRTRGITVDGEARARDFRVPEAARFDAAKAVELTNVSGKPLGEIVRETNKESINLNAELILRTVGRELGAMAPDADPHSTHERGDDEAGLAVVRQWLERAGIRTENLALHDGSGLSRLDLVTPDSAAHLLFAIAGKPSGPLFRATLPIAGSDGTLAGRLGRYRDRISAKTGTLLYDNSLSGFADTAKGQSLSFSVMCNDQTGQLKSARLLDEIAGIIAEYGSSEPSQP